MFSIPAYFVIVVSLFVSSTYCGSNQKGDSLLVMEQSSSSSNTINEIPLAKIVNTTFFNGNAMKPTTITNPLRVLKRGKRYLDFLNTARMFFRVNVKNNIITKPTIWAHGYGFRCNFPIENNKKARPFRRDTYDALGELMDKSGFDGAACILKAYCTAHMDDDIDTNKGMLFKLLKYIFTLNEEDKRHLPYLRHDNCQQILHSHCPLSFNNISPYTDDV